MRENLFDIEFDEGRGQLFKRIIIKKGTGIKTNFESRVYILGALSLDGEIPKKELARFLSSFQLLEN